MQKSNKYITGKKLVKNRVKNVVGLFTLITGLSLGSMAPASNVSYKPNVVSHELICDDVFPCPEDIIRRVDFWVTVFRLWGENDRILHDANKPERVFSVVSSEEYSCSRKNLKGDVLDEYKQVASKLDSLLNLVESGASEQELSSHSYAELFPGFVAQEIKESRENIRCQSGNRDRFVDALSSFKEYQPYVQQVLLSEGLPLDIQYLPFVESSYNPRAYSRLGAAGMWQIMPRTARSLGLQVGSAVDERLEPEFATLGAAKYFRNSIDKLTLAAEENLHSSNSKDLNPFVITSYNYGVRGMERAIAQVGTDYEKLLTEYKSASFQTAVKNFYASFLAARYVAKNQHNYFTEIKEPEFESVERVKMPKAALMKNVIKALDISKEKVRKLNPAITNSAWKNRLAVPAGFHIKIPEGENMSAISKRLDRMPRHRFGKGDSGRRHKVRPGQSACRIAGTYDVKCNDFLKLNRLTRKSVIKIGQRLKIPGGVEKYRQTDLVKQSEALRVDLVNDLPVSEVVQSAVAQEQKVIRNESALKANTGSNSSQEVVKKELSNQKVPGYLQSILDSLPQDDDYVKAEPMLEKTAVVATNASVSENAGNVKSELNLNTSLTERKGVYSLKVLPTESLAIYSDWLGTGSTRAMRKLNKIKGKGEVSVYQKVIIPITSLAQKLTFESARESYHASIQQSYFKEFEVDSITKRKLRKGETLWDLSIANKVPLWLLMHYNERALVGRPVSIPMVVSKN